jgi:hypothetical protein
VVGRVVKSVDQEQWCMDIALVMFSVSGCNLLSGRVRVRTEQKVDQLGLSANFYKTRIEVSEGIYPGGYTLLQIGQCV